MEKDEMEKMLEDLDGIELEQIYDAFVGEVINPTKPALLAECLAKSDGDEKKAKAMYLQVRVREMKTYLRCSYDVGEYRQPTEKEQRQRDQEAEMRRWGSKIEDEEDPVSPYWWSDDDEE